MTSGAFNSKVDVSGVQGLFNGAGVDRMAMEIGIDGITQLQSNGVANTMDGSDLTVDTLRM